MTPYTIQTISAVYTPNSVHTLFGANLPQLNGNFIVCSDRLSSHLGLASDVYSSHLRLFVYCQNCSKNVTYISQSKFALVGKTIYVTIVNIRQGVWWHHKYHEDVLCFHYVKFLCRFSKQYLCLFDNISHSPKVVIWEAWVNSCPKGIKSDWHIFLRVHNTQFVAHTRMVRYN